MVEVSCVSERGVAMVETVCLCERLVTEFEIVCACYFVSHGYNFATVESRTY